MTKLSSAIAALTLLACEVGPMSPTEPAPQVDDRGGTSGAHDPPTQAFPYAKAPPKECMPDPMPWSISAPIVPGVGAGGIDLTSADSSGASIEALAAKYCLPIVDGNVSFGDGPLWIHAGVRDQRSEFIVVWPGYLGAIDAKTRDGQHSLTIHVARESEYDGQPFVYDWQAPKGPGDWRNVIHDAVAATFFAGDARVEDCSASGFCVEGAFGDVGYLYLRRFGLSIWVANVHAPAPAASIPNRIDVEYVKRAPL